MDVDADITELYSLPLDEFVSARNTLAKRAKKEATAEQAASITSLRKPTTTAWLANQLARAESSTVDELLDLGTDMRAATASRDGARLRELTTRRKEVVDSLLLAARGRAEQAGYGMSDDVRAGLEETLHAALADPEAGESLRTGRLTRGLDHVGFGPVAVGDSSGGGGGSGGGSDADGAAVISLNRARSVRNARTAGAPPERAGYAGETQALPAAPVDGPAADGTGRRHGSDDDRQQRRDEAAGELDQAQSNVAAADDRVDDLAAELDRRRHELDAAEASVERLTSELEAARRDVDQARDGVDTVRSDLGDAERDAEAARARRRSAKQNLAQIDDT